MGVTSVERVVVRVCGTVQGVGFRPAVCRFARSLALAGLVRNEGDFVHIEVEGAPDTLRDFVAGLPIRMPTLARIDRLSTVAAPPRGESDFRIVESEQMLARRPAIPPDMAPCAECAAEMADPTDRRYRYPFINCTACGPRFTIVSALPYDRASTTMADFVMCGACRAEYLDAADRRFHAEPIACPACGPRVSLSRAGQVIARDEAAVEQACSLLGEGAIVAIKGVGGYALAVDATLGPAVARLRQRKRRPHKPLAVMARSLAEAERIVELDEPARRALTSPARPIVIAPRRPGDPLCAEIAPGMADIGIMLPPSPLQQLLVDGGPSLLVMTSGNRSSEPIAISEAEAEARLGDVADAIVSHDRVIHSRADDSVVRAMAGGVMPMRRARGFVPATLDMPDCPLDVPDILAVGAQQNNTVSVVCNGRVLPSQHIGDLSVARTRFAFERVLGDLMDLSGAAPLAVAHDLHPNYASTLWAQSSGLECLAVQHHHAHVASCMVDNGVAEPVLGVVLDGTGYGDDGTLWGGEILWADLRSYRRLGHLRQLALVGGEAAIRFPWRMAVAALCDADESLDWLDCAAPEEIARVRSVIAGGSPRLLTPTSGAGRWFDAVAVMCGAGRHTSYDGQAPAELEAMAQSAPERVAPYPFEVDRSGAGPLAIDLRMAVRAIAREVQAGSDRARIAARFHETMAAACAAACRSARADGAPGTVVLSGGCFQNRRLLVRARALLEQDGFQVLVHRTIPPGDGGISVGQAAIACHMWQRLHAAGKES